MNDVCFYSGLPYTCDLCPEDEAPCDFMKNKKKNECFESKCDYCNSALHDCSLCGVSQFDNASNGEPIC